VQKLVTACATASLCQTMYKSSIFLAALLAVSSPARATWSVVAVDPITREVGVAVATCVPEPNGSRILPQVAGVAPGIGALAAQAQFNQQTRDRAVMLLRSGTEPQAILDQVNASDPGSAQRQYGVVTLSGGAAHYTGSQNSAWAGAVNSQVVSVQGNILVGREVVDDALRAFAETRPCEDTLADKLLRALEAGRARGGDGRCTREQGALVAVLRVAAPGESGDNPSLNLVVTSPRGSSTPVALLKQAYDRYRADHPAAVCDPMVDGGPPAAAVDAGSGARDAGTSTADAGFGSPSERDASATEPDVTDAGRNEPNARDASTVDAASARPPARDASSMSPIDGQSGDDDDGVAEEPRSRPRGRGCALSGSAEGSYSPDLALVLLALTLVVYRRRRSAR
jgi:MYXO-CTERM domain-containing protein